jgi:GMP reductase
MMHLEQEILLDFKDVLIRPKRSTLTSRKEVELTREYNKFKHSPLKYRGIPVLAANMDTTGTTKMAVGLEKFGLGVCLHKFYTVEELITHFESIWSGQTWFSMGITDNDLAKWKTVTTHFGVSLIPARVCIDVANGYHEKFVEFVKHFRQENPEVLLMAGNVVTGDMTEALILAGADVVKVGIGPGSVCTTRKMTGVGYPQLSAIIECADAAHGLGGHVCADGGCTVPGDVAKAFGAGADFVMLGSMFAGHDECNGEIIEKHFVTKEPVHPSYNDRQYEKKQFMRFYGMSSEAAMDKHYGGVAEHRASEGKEVLVPYKGPVADTVRDILGGLRSACTYTGSKSLKELSKRTTFVRVSQQLNEIYGKSE